MRCWSKISYLTSSELSVLPAQHHINAVNRVINSRMPRMKGRNVFHVRAIRRSYRIRGSVPRIQINVNARRRVLIENNKSINRIGPEDEENRAVVNILIARIEVYSAINSRAKGPLLYSVLKPETSSDSPSARSNGVRFVSASIVINQIIATGESIRPGHVKKEKENKEKLNV
jgi:hypothetical protein